MNLYLKVNLNNRYLGKKDRIDSCRIILITLRRSINYFRLFLYLGETPTKNKEGEIYEQKR